MYKRQESASKNGLNKLSKSSSLPTLIQPQMRFKPRNDVERVFDEVNKNHFSNVNPKIEKRLRQKLSVAINNTEKIDSSLLYIENKKENNNSKVLNATRKNSLEKANENYETNSKFKKSKLNNVFGNKKGLNQLNEMKRINKVLYLDKPKKTYFKGITSLNLINEARRNDPADRYNHNLDDSFSSYEEEGKEENSNQLICNNYKNLSKKVISGKRYSIKTPRKSMLDKKDKYMHLSGMAKYDKLDHIKDNQSPFKEKEEQFTHTKMDQLYRLAFDNEIKTYKEKLCEKKKYKAFLDRISIATKQMISKGKLCKLLKDPTKFFEDFYFKTYTKDKDISNKIIINELNLQVTSKQVQIAASKVLKLCGIRRNNKNADDYHKVGEGKLMFTNGKNIVDFIREKNL